MNHTHCINQLKALDMLGNQQRPVFSLGVSQRMHQITNFDSIGQRSCKRIMNEEHSCCTNVCAFRFIGKGLII